MAKAKKKAAKKAPARRIERPSAGRAMWKGMLGFGLVQVPVSVHSAAVRDELPFHQLDSRDLAPIGYRRVNKSTGEEVEWGDIVKGYEVSKGEYVVLTDEELAKANVEATRSIDITTFVDANAIPVAYFETPYYLAPEKRAMKAYAVLREAMERAGKIAIGTVMLRQREHLCAVVPSGDALMLEILRYGDEIKAPDSLELPGKAAKASDREITMAKDLVEKMSDAWDPSRFHDQYKEHVLALVEEKSKTGRIAPRKSTRVTATKASNLAALLRKSLESTKRKESKRGKAA